jgi:ubiquitin-like 1-activating enzyme E1 B
LDTIDVSNLNRQFLFRSRHVGMAKCKVASEAALGMVPPMERSEATYQPHHGNVLDNTRFNVPYVQSFSLVLNALDNITARRRVNRLCLAASIPLIEAGTAGYLGQVTVIDKNAGVECYECQAKATQKVYPICTIRSTPSMPVHCIVWAKELYKLCFGGKGELISWMHQLFR